MMFSTPNDDFVCVVLRGPERVASTYVHRATAYAVPVNHRVLHEKSFSQFFCDGYANWLSRRRFRECVLV